MNALVEEQMMSKTKPEEHEAEAGYVMAMTALLLIPMLIFAAFAVDVGAWYAQAARTQRAADAAALAAVVWMPNEEAATTAALDVAARNGFVDGENAVIVVERVGEQQVRVRITAEGEVYFGAVVMDSISIERFAVAEYVLPVPMGNPSSALGTGDLDGSVDGIWLAVNGICWSRQQGDPFSVRRVGSSYQYCDAGGGYSGTANDVYDPEGYVYIIDVPDDGSGGSVEVHVQVYEPGICDKPGPQQGVQDKDNGWGPRLNFRLYAADDTPLSDQDNLDQPPVADVSFGQSDCNNGLAGDNHWYQVATIPEDSPGRWFLRVRGISHELSGDNADRVGSLNGYAIRLARGGSTTTCSSLSDDACPQIYAKDWLSIWRPDLGGGVASFYLAEIGAGHAGKTLEIVLFDPGEGMDNIQILSPGGTRTAFEYQTYNCSMFGESCPDPALQNDADCNGNPCVKTTSEVFQDTAVRILIELPPSYNCDGEPQCWWKIRYQPDGSDSAHDRTTWSVRVIGDPVRLTE